FLSRCSGSSLDLRPGNAAAVGEDHAGLLFEQVEDRIEVIRALLHHPVEALAPEFGAADVRKAAERDGLEKPPLRGLLQELEDLGKGLPLPLRDPTVGTDLHLVAQVGGSA